MKQPQVENKPGYNVRDRRGSDRKSLPCRVCGCPTEEHSTSYKASPTPQCREHWEKCAAALRAIVRSASPVDKAGGDRVMVRADLMKAAEQLVA